MHAVDDGVSIYPVGALHDLLIVWRTALRAPSHLGWAFRKLRSGFRSGSRRRSYWNGYLAEPTTSNAWTRAGHGWTKRRARRSLDLHFIELVDRATRV
jgi:hypothetical protein